MATGSSEALLLSTEGGDRCPVCAGPARPSIDLGDYRLFRCYGCGSWSSDAQLRGASTSFVPESYFENAELDRDKWEALLSRLPERGEKLRSLLDVGCGTGAFLGYTSRRFPDALIDGIELDEDRAARARLANPHARIHQGDAMELALQVGGPFDLITLWDVFEHVTAPTRLLASLARSLSPGGCIYVQTIHEKSLVPAAGRLCYAISGGRMRYPARRTHEPHHLVFFTRQGLEHAASASGLHVRELWFDRLHHGRMDGGSLLTALAALALRAENALGGGLFANLLLERAIADDEQVLVHETLAQAVEPA